MKIKSSPEIINKSPVLGKNSFFIRYTNFGFNKKSNNNMIKSQNFKKGIIIHIILQI